MLGEVLLLEVVVAVELLLPLLWKPLEALLVVVVPAPRGFMLVNGRAMLRLKGAEMNDRRGTRR